MYIQMYNEHDTMVIFVKFRTVVVVMDTYDRWSYKNPCNQCLFPQKL